MKITEQHINKTINETIKAMAADRETEMIDGLRQLASWWKTAGTNLGQSFGELCQYMEDEAVLRAGTDMVRLRIRVALQQASKDRIQVGAH